MKKTFKFALLAAAFLAIGAFAAAAPVVSPACAEDPGHPNEIKDPGVVLDPAVAEVHTACPGCQDIVGEHNKYAASYNGNLRSVAQAKRLATIGEQVILSAASDIQKKQQLMQTPDVEAQIAKLKKDMEDYKTDSAKDKQKLDNLLKTQTDLQTKMKAAGEKLAECEKQCVGKNKTGTDPAAAPAGDSAGNGGPARLPGFIYDDNGTITDQERHGDKTGYQTRCPRCEMLAVVYNKTGESLRTDLLFIGNLEKKKQREIEKIRQSVQPLIQRRSVEDAGHFYAQIIAIEEEYDAAIRLRRADADELTEQLRALAAKLGECEKQCLPKEGSASGAPVASGLPFDWQGPYKTDCEACSKLVAELNRLPGLALERLARLQDNKQLVSRLTEALKSPDSAKLVRRYMGVFETPATGFVQQPEKGPQTADDVKKMIGDREADNEKIQSDLKKITDQFNKVLKMLQDCERQCKALKTGKTGGAADDGGKVPVRPEPKEHSQVTPPTDAKPGCSYEDPATLAALPFDKRMEAQRKTSDALSGELRMRIAAEAAVGQKYRKLTADLNGRHGPNGMSQADYQSALSALKADEDRELAPLHKTSIEARQCLGDFMKALANAAKAGRSGGK